MAVKRIKRKGTARDAELERRWRDLISRQSAGDVGVRAFCAAAGVPESGFYHWRRELKRRDKEAKARGSQCSESFVPVRLAVGSSSSVELELSSGRVLRLNSGFEPARVAELIKLLEA